MCDRHAGIGADGLITYSALTDGMRMRLFNADGSASEVSGNGVRCLAALAVREHPQATTVTIETLAGPKVLELTDREGTRLTFRAFMGPPQDIQRLGLKISDETIDVIALSVGNPQCVRLVATLQDSELHRLGPLLERHPAFPNRTNVSFVQVQAPDRLNILIWERGVGPTMASGTGACGAAVAAASYGGAARDVLVTSPGGTQRVEWLRDGIYLTGKAELTLDGTWLAVSD
jgi:diaminopimelate epimerase